MKKVTCFILIMMIISFSVPAQSQNTNGNLIQKQDQIKDGEKKQEQVKDGSCGEVACDPVQTQDQTRTQDQTKDGEKKQEQVKDGSCGEAA